MIDVAVIAGQWRAGVGHGTLAKNLELLSQKAREHGINIGIFRIKPLFELKIGEKNLFGFVSMWPVRYLQRPSAKLSHALDPSLAIPKSKIITFHDIAQLRYPEIYLKNTIARLEWKYRCRRLREAHRVVCVSQFSKKEAMELLGIPSLRIKVIYQGIDHKTFFVDKGRSRWRQPNKINIVSAANNDPRKNFPLLVEAVGILQEMGKEVNLVRFGPSEWVDEAEKIRRVAKKWNVKIVEPGVVPVEELRKAYSTFDVFVWPSLYEGFGYPPLEAMACGCKVVALDTEFNREFLGDVPVYVKNDAREMAEGILEALKMDIGQRGIEQAKKFTWEKWAEEHIRLYKQILSS